MAHINTNMNQTKEMDCLLANCTIEQIEVEDYIHKLMECGFMSRDAVQQRKEKTNNLRYWFVVYVPQIYGTLVFYQTTSKNAYKVKNKSADMYELPNNITSLLLHAGETTNLNRFVDLSRGIFVPSDIFADANVQQKKSELTPKQLYDLNDVATRLEKVIPFHDGASAAYKNFMKELFSCNRKVWYEKHNADDAVVQTSYYYPKLIYCLQFIFRARNLEVLRKKFTALPSIKDAEIRKHFLDKAETFLKEIASLYEKDVTLLYKTMHLLNHMSDEDEKMADETSKKFEGFIKNRAKYTVRDGSMYIIDPINKKQYVYPQEYFKYYRAMLDMDKMAQRIRDFYDEQNGEEYRKLALAFAKYNSYDAEWMQVFVDKVTSDVALNSQDENLLQQNEDLKRTMQALQDCKEQEKARLKSEADLAYRKQKEQETQRKTIEKLERSKQQLEKYIRTEFVPTVQAFRAAQNNLQSNKIETYDGFLKQLYIKNKEYSVLQLVQESDLLNLENSVDADMMEVLYADLYESEQQQKAVVKDEKLKQFMQTIKVANASSNAASANKGVDDIQITKIVQRADENLLTQMIDVVEKMKRYTQTAMACYDRYEILSMYTKMQNVFSGLQKDIAEIKKCIELLPVFSKEVYQNFEKEIEACLKTPEECIACSQLQLGKVEEYEKQVHEVLAKYKTLYLRINQIYMDSCIIPEIAELQKKENYLYINNTLQVVFEKYKVDKKDVSNLREIVLDMFESTCNKMYLLYTPSWDVDGDLESTLTRLEKRQAEVKQFYETYICQIAKYLTRIVDGMYNNNLLAKQLLDIRKPDYVDDFINDCFEEASTGIFDSELRVRFNKDIKLLLRDVLQKIKTSIHNVLQKSNLVIDELEYDVQDELLNILVAVRLETAKMEDDEYAMKNKREFFDRFQDILFLMQDCVNSKLKALELEVSGKTSALENNRSNVVKKIHKEMMRVFNFTEDGSFDPNDIISALNNLKK